MGGSSDGGNAGGTDGGAPGVGGRGGSPAGGAGVSGADGGNNGGMSGSPAGPDGGAPNHGSQGPSSPSSSPGGSAGGVGGDGGFMGEVDTGGLQGGGLGVDGGISAEAISAANEAAGYGQSANDAAAAFGGWQTSVDTQMSPENTAYGANTSSHTYGGTFGDNLVANPISMHEATSRAQQSIQSNAKPGLIGRIASWGLTALGQPVAATATNVGLRGYNAAQQAEAHNAQFGTNVDTGLASNIGQQAVGSIASTAGSMVGGRLGAKAGASIAGMEGAIGGGILGSMGLGSAARGAAMSGIGGQGTTGPAGQSPGGNDRDAANMTDANAIARAREESERNKALESHPIGQMDTSQMYGYQPKYTFDSLSGDALKSFYS